MMLFATLALAQPMVLSVSPKGPLNSLTAAVESARQLRKSDQAVRIELAAGTYPLNKTIELGPKDSGLTIVGRGKVRLVGGRFLTGGRASRDARLASAARGKVMEFDLGDLDPGVMTRRGFGLPKQVAGLELFLAGVPARPAQWPNEGDWQRIEAVTSPERLQVASDRPSGWSRDNEVWVHGYWHHDWAESYEPVRQIEGRTVTLANKPGTFDVLAGRRFRFLNVLEELDQEGEYVVDRKQGKVFVWPSAEGRKEVLASELNGPMFVLNGASDIRFENLVLEGGRDSAVRATGGKRLSVLRCKIVNFGTYGVSFENCSDSIVKSCDLTGLGESGITLNAGDRQTLAAANLEATDNHIWAYSRWGRTYNPAIHLLGVGNRVTRNWIHDAPHNAILLGGNDHLIEGNRIERVCTETGDAGAIYMGRNPTMRGVVVRHNLLKDLGPKISTEGNYTGVMGVYLDDCWCGTTVEGNVFDMSGTGIMIGGGRDNTVENNVFLGNQPGIHFDARGIGWAKDFFKESSEWGMYDRFREVPADKPPYTTKYPQLATYLQDQPAFPKGNRIARNIAAGGKWMTLLDGLTEKDFAHEDNVVEPIQLTLSQALQRKPKGFRPIPLDKIGLVTKR